MAPGDGAPILVAKAGRRRTVDVGEVRPNSDTWEGLVTVLPIGMAGDTSLSVEG